MSLNTTMMNQINKEGQETMADQREYIKSLEELLTSREEVINLMEAKIQSFQDSNDKKVVNDEKLWNNYTILKHNVTEILALVDEVADVMDIIEENHQHS